MKRLLVIICSVLLLSSCTSSSNVSNKTTAVTPKATEKTITLTNIQDFKKIDGSTVTIPLSKAIAKKLTGCSDNLMNNYIMHNKTHSAYLNLLDKKADIIFVTYPSEEELNLAKQYGIEYEIVPVVRDAFIFMVNKNNPVSGLTTKQIQEIYSGKITNWKDVSGNNLKIIPYQRPENSGSQTGMLNLVMKDVKLMKPPSEVLLPEMGDVVEAISSYDNSPSALGYSYYYYANSMYVREAVKFLEVDGFAPNPENIIFGKYPFTTAYYAVIRKDEPKDSFARKLLSYILSEEGQNIAAEAAYVKVK